mmetsp:Transcript_21911/g.32167  ORF Transcript_21911/g.32167 Transcript_21911/m.32167 type:complete len:106 (-) Transcript_21911:685-1002(-)
MPLLRWLRIPAAFAAGVAAAGAAAAAFAGVAGVAEDIAGGGRDTGVADKEEPFAHSTAACSAGGRSCSIGPAPGTCVAVGFAVVAMEVAGAAAAGDGVDTAALSS